MLEITKNGKPYLKVTDTAYKFNAEIEAKKPVSLIEQDHSKEQNTGLSNN
jgi:hypothetical protein